MNKKIFISFPSSYPADYREVASIRINQILSGINKEVSDWNGFVDFIEITHGHYGFVAKCDNEDVLEKMQLLIDASGINSGNTYGIRLTA